MRNYATPIALIIHFHLHCMTTKVDCITFWYLSKKIKYYDLICSEYHVAVLCINFSVNFSFGWCKIVNILAKTCIVLHKHAQQNSCFDTNLHRLIWTSLFKKIHVENEYWSQNGPKEEKYGVTWSRCGVGLSLYYQNSSFAVMHVDKTN